MDLSSPFRLGILPILGNASMLKKATLYLLIPMINMLLISEMIDFACTISYLTTKAGIIIIQYW